MNVIFHKCAGAHKMHVSDQSNKTMKVETTCVTYIVFEQYINYYRIASCCVDQDHLIIGGKEQWSCS